MDQNRFNRLLVSPTRIDQILVLLTTRGLLIKKVGGVIRFKDQKLQEKLDIIMLNQDGSLHFERFLDLVNQLQEENLPEESAAAIALIRNPFEDLFGIISNALSGKTPFIDPDYNDIKNCFEITLLIASLALVYYTAKGIELHIIPYQYDSINGASLKRSYSVIFKDIDDSHYLYLFGKSARPLESSLQLLTRSHLMGVSDLIEKLKIFLREHVELPNSIVSEQ